MINFLKGKIIYSNICENYIILLTNDVGYKVFVNIDILSSNNVNSIVELFIHTYVSQDDIKLFGFKKIEHLQFFQKLISISGIGPKSALNFFNFNIEEIILNINLGNIENIPKIPGIGNKTIQKIILELKGKIDIKSINNGINQINLNIKEAKEALINLGFNLKDIENKLKNIENINNLTTEEIIKFFLKSN